MSAYLVGYLLVLAGGILALWKWGLWQEMDKTWRWVVVLVALGLGVMVAVANSGRKEDIEIDTK